MTRRDIIVIGASAGGLEALSKLTSAWPADFSASILVVVHTSPNSLMLFPEIVGRHSQLKMSYGAQGEQPLPGNLYFAPPDHHLTVESPGFMMLTKAPKENHSRPAADVLFRSAATTYGPRVIAIILTGGDGDGTEGFWAVKRAGGLCLVQEPREAKDPSMPRNAIVNDDPDYRVGLVIMVIEIALFPGEPISTRYIVVHFPLRRRRGFFRQRLFRRLLFFIGPARSLGEI